MVVRHKLSTDDSVVTVSPENPEETSDEALFLSVAVQEHYINPHRTETSNTLFSLPYPGFDLSRLPVVRAADVLNLHWVAYFQSPVVLQRLTSLGKPTVWTLHDQWPFTGGCHVASGCDKYREDCRDCPQLADDPFGLPKAVLADKVELLQQADITVVAPSQWLATCASESRLFGDAWVLVIPNSVDPDFFSPIPKAEARETLALPQEGVVLLYGATDVREKLKGSRELRDALDHCWRDQGFRRLAESGMIRLLCFGHGTETLRAGNVPTEALGFVAPQEDMRSAYCAADVFILPSLEDNLPNTMLEAMSCGVPVVAFDAGGIPEVIEDGVTGRLAQVADARGLGEAILSLVFEASRREGMGHAARKLILADYTPARQAVRYMELYESLLDRRHTRAAEGGATERPSLDSAVSEEETGNTLQVPVDTGLGSHFQEIYDAVLLRALREFAVAREWDYRQSEADRRARLRQTAELGQLLQESESDRAARLEQIEELNGLLQESEADREARLEQIEELTRLLQESEADRAARLQSIERLSELLQESEADRAARLNVIRDQEARIAELEEKLRSLESRAEVRLRRKLGQLLDR